LAMYSVTSTKFTSNKFANLQIQSPNYLIILNFSERCKFRRLRFLSLEYFPVAQ